MDQHGKNFLDLPMEIRLIIYEHLFSSTTLTFTERPADLEVDEAARPVRDSLAILRTCRQINYEADSLWLGLVDINFKNPLCMINKFSRMPSAILSGIRILDRLIDQGNGWKELWFITPNSKVLGFDNEKIFAEGRQLRWSQPDNWNNLLSWRDGINSGASVTIYRSTKPNAPGSVMSKHTRQLFKQKSDVENPADYGEDKGLMSEDKTKELLVVVRRGPKAHIREQAEMFKELDHWTYDASWEEIRQMCYDFACSDVGLREFTQMPKPSVTSFPSPTKVWDASGMKMLPYRSYSNMFDGWLV
ncbi:hypothetical protein N7540_006500 [Penicillium herquei]|nr:hypothetical protein N7540_006500 [Penicillium herquei]